MKKVDPVTNEDDKTAMKNHTDEWQNATVSSRLGELDLLRGVALFGILLANVHQMFMPVEIANYPVDFTGNKTFTFIEWFTIESLVSSKFLTLFSMLFGVGFAIQIAALKSRNHGRYRVIYLRRILVLAGIGIMHGLFLYGADVLLYYAVTAFILLWLCELRATTLLKVGVALILCHLLLGFVLEWGSSKRALVFLFGVLFIAVTAWFSGNNMRQLCTRGCMALLVAVFAYAMLASADSTNTSQWQELQELADRSWQAIDHEAKSVVIDNRNHRVPLTDEVAYSMYQASLDKADRITLQVTGFRDGPASLAQSLRKDQFIHTQTIFVFFYFWRTLAIFMIGLGLVKYGMLNKYNDQVIRTIIKVGGLGGLLLSVLSTSLKALAATTAIQVNAWAFLLHEISVYMLASGLAAMVILWSKTKHWIRVQNTLKSTGRMALTNYLAQSALMLFIASGLGLYGMLSRPQLAVLAIMVFVFLAVLSSFWMSRFRSGPVERVWRLLTYFR